MSALPVSALLTPAPGDRSAVSTPASTRRGSGKVGTRSGRRVHYKIAARREELAAAFGLVYQAYLWSGLAKPNAHRMRVTPFQLLPTTEVFVAVERGEVACTMSLVGDGDLGLPMESLYSREIGLLRAEGIRLGEVSCLANRHQGVECSFPITVRLMGLMAQCARKRGIDVLVIAVHPRHAKFYEHFIAFTPIGEEKAYRAVCGNPAVALALNLGRLAKDHPRVYQRFFGEPFPDEVLRYRPIADNLRLELSHVSAESYDPATSCDCVMLAAS